MQDVRRQGRHADLELEADHSHKQRDDQRDREPMTPVERLARRFDDRHGSLICAKQAHSAEHRVSAECHERMAQDVVDERRPLQPGKSHARHDAVGNDASG